MSLEFGEYFIISGAYSLPFKQDRIVSLLADSAFDISITKVSFYDALPSELEYNKIMEGHYSQVFKDSLSPRDFSQLTFICAEGIVYHLYSTRLSVDFLDSQSYSISLIFSQEELLKSAKSKEFIERITSNFFSTLTPFYGHFGVEESVAGLRVAQDGTAFLGLNNSFLCNKYLEKSETNKYLHKNCEMRPLADVGVLLSAKSKNNINLYDLL